MTTPLEGNETLGLGADNTQNQNSDKFFIMRKQKKWENDNPVFYPSRGNPRVELLTIGSKIIVEKELRGDIMFIGHGEIESIEDLPENSTEFPSEKPNTRYKVALRNFVRFYPPRMKNPEMRLILRSLPGYNWHDSIRIISKEVYDYIVQICSNENWSLFIQEQSPLVRRNYTTLEDMLSDYESETLEFKSSLKVPTEPTDEMIETHRKIENCSDKKEKLKLQEILKGLESRQKKGVEHSIIKTIAAFLNTQGGILLVGITDQKHILGIEKDYESFGEKKDWDGWSSHLKNLINSNIGPATTPQIYVEPIIP